MADRKTKIGLIGCGAISGIYFKKLKEFEHVEVSACADINREASKARGKEFGIPKICSVRKLLADPEIEIVLNLTVPKAHAKVAFAALRAGKSVYNEKPLAVKRSDGRRMLELAAAKNLRVGCAPDTFLGGGLQTCRKLIDDGVIGEPVAAAAFMLCHGPEGWHPNPEFYYEVGGGPMFDMGPYYLTALVNLVGPIRRVTSMARITFPERLITSEPKKGKKIIVETPTHIAGIMEFANGAIGTITTSFDVYGGRLPRIEIYGTKGTLAVPDPNGFGGEVWVRLAGRARVDPAAADARLCRELPRHRRGRHGARHALRPAAPRERRAGLPRPRHDAVVPRFRSQGKERPDAQHVRAPGAAARRPRARQTGPIVRRPGGCQPCEGSR